ncbi:MAG: hypothetical protein A2854_03215 [Parcubacteria group bacterium RIFCSPHIGHO2_01_FULL_56_18]|nr:MAG: hypothetical protein A2854_03215 [Parcubacteria group bacterium RIFCSPHIGHO2_01_FULL_56_18]
MTDSSFHDVAQELLREMQQHNDEADRIAHRLATEVDTKLAAADDALEEFARELEKGETDTAG